jgi:tetratricopeptide (TPR) repeat protein
MGFLVKYIFLITQTISTFWAHALFSQESAKLDSLISLLENTKDDSTKVYLQVSIAREYLKKDIIESIYHGEEAMVIAENSKNQKLISYALFNLGATLYQQGMMELSIPYFLKYLEANKALNDQKAIGYALTNIGAIYLQIGDLEQSESYFNQALRRFEEAYVENNKSGKEIISIYNNLGIISKRKKETDKAISLYEKGILLAREFPNASTELGNLLNNLGTIHLEMGNLKVSEPYLFEAFELRKSKDDQLGLIKSHLTLGNYHEIQNQNDLALASYYKALHLSKKLGTLSSKAEAQKLLFKLYQKQSQYDSALKYHISYSEVKEDLNEEDALKELKLFEINSQFQEREKMLLEEAKRKEQEYQFIGLILFLASVIFGLLYFLSRSRSRRLSLERENLLLQSKNLSLEKSKMEKEIEYKNKELATGVIYQLQKAELISEAIEKLKSIKPDEKLPSSILNSALSDLKKTQNQSAWNEFELRFQQVHEDFYKRLQNLLPSLTINERRLCAFLKLNLSTKEISSITGQSCKSIEIARTRMRKKLKLTNTDKSLIEFIASI